MYEFRTTRRVEFADTDVGGICHFSRYAVFMETAEHEFLRELGTSVHATDGERTIGWPRVKLECEFLGPARFEQRLDIRVVVLRKGKKSLTYGFEISCEGRRLARGKMTSVCCVLGEATLRAIPIPEALADRIEQAPEGSWD